LIKKLTYLGEHFFVVIAEVLLIGLVVCCIEILHHELSIVQLLF